MTPEEADEMSKYTGTMSEWIKPSTRVPERDERVLVDLGNNRVEISSIRTYQVHKWDYGSTGQWMETYEPQWQTKGVIGWMELPKGDNND